MPALERRIGKVTAYRPESHAAHIHLQEPLSVGDTLHIQGPQTETEERIDTIQLPHGETKRAEPGDDVNIPLRQPVQEGARVYRVEDPYDDADASVLNTAF